MMDGRDGIVSEKCREKALRLLEMRPHASGEIRLKLRKNRDFPPAVIEEIISDFTRVGLLNDRQFVALFCEEKKSAMTPPGRYKVALALRRKGLPADIINEVMAEVWDRHDGLTDDDGNFDDDGLSPELARAIRAATPKWQSLCRRAEPSPQLRVKLMRFLAGRGYAGDIIRQASDRVCCQRE
ncbi:regulatory protein RecX [Oligosphaera ethanolica]|uniref:Regulatory protein RecX n=1 Tax=Oligosphaera ethanolica TaxID=760260 RepID=A0AAE3VIG0_9BACT|nr:regulatory protein RecX [Oligosphaera ethanolica]MDQ0290871.1 SOS response regulatory protein OraA/RecX [Oligosphaera ethanolica]